MLSIVRTDPAGLVVVSVTVVVLDTSYPQLALSCTTEDTSILTRGQWTTNRCPRNSNAHRRSTGYPPETGPGPDRSDCPVRVIEWEANGALLPYGDRTTALGGTYSFSYRMISRRI
jgi:hypothetical protein